MAHKPGVRHFHNRLSISVRGISVKALPSSRHNGTITNSTLLACSCQVAFHPNPSTQRILPNRASAKHQACSEADGWLLFSIGFCVSFSLSFAVFFVVTSFYFIFAPCLPSTSRKGTPGSLITYLHSGFLCVSMCVFIRIL